MATPSKPYQVFARRYRPQNFTEIVGQDEVSRVLQNQVADGRVGNAYLFCGSRGVGKTSMARILAKALNCMEGPTPNPCGKCEHCLAIREGHAMDVLEIDGASNNGVEKIRELCESVYLSPFSCRTKVYIIDEVHMLSIAAFNALLKTLEEPPPHVKFVFATTEPAKIPETITSRCQVFNFRRIHLEDIVRRLDAILSKQEDAKIQEQERRAILEAIAMSAEGGMRDAEVALDQVLALSDGELRLEEVEKFLGVVEHQLLEEVLSKILDRDTRGLLHLINDLVEKGRDLERFVKNFLNYLRELMLIKAQAPASLLSLSEDRTEKARELAGKFSHVAMMNLINQFLALEQRLKGSFQARLLLEFTLVKLTALPEIGDLDSLISQIDAGGGARPRGEAISSPQVQAPDKPKAARASEDAQPELPLLKQSRATQEPEPRGVMESLKASYSPPTDSVTAPAAQRRATPPESPPASPPPQVEEEVSAAGFENEDREVQNDPATDEYKVSKSEMQELIAKKRGSADRTRKLMNKPEVRQAVEKVLELFEGKLIDDEGKPLQL
ncbi:MAG: DNA polymerase III subunit gamma/tau [bacterium]